MLNLLKTVVKTNSANATILRHEERKVLSRARVLNVISKREEEESEESLEDKAKSELFYNTYQNLRHKRTHELRKRQRNIFLAYAFLRGWQYENVEDFSYTIPDWDEVEVLIFHYMDDREDPRDIKQKYERWVQTAAKYIKDNTKEE